MQTLHKLGTEAKDLQTEFTLLHLRRQKWQNSSPNDESQEAVKRYHPAVGLQKSRHALQLHYQGRATAADRSRRLTENGLERKVQPQGPHIRTLETGARYNVRTQKYNVRTLKYNIRTLETGDEVQCQDPKVQCQDPGDWGRGTMSGPKSTMSGPWRLGMSGRAK